jgi:hypothetical protein
VRTSGFRDAVSQGGHSFERRIVARPECGDRLHADDGDALDRVTTSDTDRDGSGEFKHVTGHYYFRSMTVDQHFKYVAPYLVGPIRARFR